MRTLQRTSDSKRDRRTGTVRAIRGLRVLGAIGEGNGADLNSVFLLVELADVFRQVLRSVGAKQDVFPFLNFFFEVVLDHARGIHVRIGEFNIDSYPRDTSLIWASRITQETQKTVTTPAENRFNFVDIFTSIPFGGSAIGLPAAFP